MDYERTHEVLAAFEREGVLTIVPPSDNDRPKNWFISYKIDKKES